MGKSRKDSGKRGAKRAEKAQKRARKLDARRREAARPPANPIDEWRPLQEGIEGLARRLTLPQQMAARVADAAAQVRPSASSCWLPTRVAALETDALLGLMADRGVSTSEPELRALALAHEAARTLAEQAWWPALGPEATPHDRDLLSEAAEVLWRRWCPDLLSNEQIEDTLHAAARALEARPVDGAAARAGIMSIWHKLRSQGGLVRLGETGMDAYLGQLLADITELSPASLDLSVTSPELEIAAALDPSDLSRARIEAAIWAETSDPAVQDAILDAHLAALALDPASPCAIGLATLLLELEGEEVTVLQATRVAAAAAEARVALGEDDEEQHHGLAYLAAVAAHFIDPEEDEGDEDDEGDNEAQPQVTPDALPG